MKKLLLVLVKKRTLLLVIFLCVCALVIGKGQSEATAQAEKQLKVALILSGPANDQGWNAVAVQGLTEAEEKFGIKTAYSEHVGIADGEAVFTNYAFQGYDLIIGHGFQYGDPAVRVGKKFPGIKFLAIEAASSSENVASYVIACEQAGYLMGVLAASLSKSGKIGIVGGVEQPSIIKVVEAYKLGAKSVKPDIKVYDSYIGSFTDVSLGKEAALAMADKGADVLSHIANQAGTGVIKAAEERGLLATGDSWDQNVIAPDTVVCSTIYSVPILVMNAVEKVKNGTFEGGIFNLGMDLGVVDIASFHSFDEIIPQNVKNQIADLKEQILNGTFKVPVIEKSTSN
ncbi:BMP family protein [bacterium]|nr:BMP family protein [bacterium]MBU4602573.1 BMP family protein [bacterium]